MNLIQYIRLVPANQRFLWIGMLIINGLIAVAMIGSKSKPVSESAFLLFMAPLAVSGLLGQVSHAVLSRPATALLPGIEGALFRWNVVISIIGACVWGLLIHTAAPAIPLATAALLTAGLCTMGLHLRRTEWRFGNLILAACGVVIGISIAGSRSVPFAITRIITEYPLAAGLIGAAGAIFNFWRNRDRAGIKRQELTKQLEPQNASFRGLISSLDLRRVSEIASPQKYSPVSDSLWSWIGAIDGERQGPGFKRSIIILTILALLAYPLLDGAGGYPNAWYRIVFDWSTDGGAEVAGMVLVWMVMIGLGLLAPFPRRDYLYPITRTRRAELAFFASVSSWLFVLLIWIGGHALVAITTGLLTDQPISGRELIRFVVPAAGMGIPLLALLRWAFLYFEGRSAVALGTICGLSLLGASIGWGFLAVVNPSTSIVVASVGIVVSLVVYRQSLRSFYGEEDLAFRSAGKFRLVR